MVKNETYFGNFQALCGNAEIVRIGDEQKQGWIIELSLVFFSSTAVVGYVKFQMDFIHPSFRVWINTSTLDFSLKKNDKRWSRGIVLEFRSTIALSTIQMKAFAVLPSSPPPFLCKKWDWNNFSNPWKLHKNVSMHFHILLTFLVKLNCFILTIFGIVSSNWSATFSRFKKKSRQIDLLHFHDFYKFSSQIKCCIFTILKPNSSIRI